MKEKKCSKCRVVKPFKGFDIRYDRPTGSGVIAVCKVCKSKYNNRYNKTHKRQISDQKKRYYEFNRESKLAYMTKHRKRNEEYYRKKSREYQKQHPEKFAESNRRHRALKFNAIGSFTNEDFSVLCRQYGNECLRCHRTDRLLTADHVIPLIKGGSDYIQNIQPLCRWCNSFKRDRSFDYRRHNQVAQAGPNPWQKNPS